MTSLPRKRVVNDWSGQMFPRIGRHVPIVGDVVPDPRHVTLSVIKSSAHLGPIFQMQLFKEKLVMVGTASLAAELCDESRFQKALTPGVSALREFGADGLFTAFNDETNWQLAHDLLMPAFTKSAMRSYHPVMVETATQLFDYWDRHIDGAPVDVARDMTKLTMETLSRAALGHDFRSFSSSRPHPFVVAMVSLLSTARAKSALGSAPGGKVVTRILGARHRNHQHYIDTMLESLIAERPETDERRDLLGIMLNVRHPETGEKLSRANIRRQILTFLIAGHETTSGALSFCLYYLATNPSCLAAAQAEADQLLGDDACTPTFEQVGKFRYLRRVLDEALRIWPTVPGFARSPRTTTTISTGHTMRPSDYAIILLGRVHSDPSVWPDPDRFDPDRFLPENVKRRPAHSYKPFGAGVRACIGRQFAIHESVLVLASLLHRYDIHGDPEYDLRVTERLTMMPTGLALTLRPRRGSAPGASGE